MSDEGAEKREKKRRERGEDGDVLNELKAYLDAKVWRIGKKEYVASKGASSVKV